MILKNSFSKKSNHILFFLLICLFIYVAFRAYTISFTHDEGLTYMIIQGDVHIPNTANNHLLNTWLVSLFNAVFGNQEIFLRFPNILAFAIYLYFSYKIIAKQNKLVLTILGIVLLLFNSYLLDFFSLARGYGLAIGFSLAALYFAVEKESKTCNSFFTRTCFSLFFSLLAAYSNLIYINLNISIVILFSIEIYWAIKSKSIYLNKKKALSLILILAINFTFLTPLINQLLLLKEHNELYYGGANSFLQDTMLSLIRESYNLPYKINLVIASIFISLFVISIIYLIIYRNERPTSLYKSTIALSLMIIASVLQHIFLDALYPIHRTALVFILLSSLNIYYLFEHLINHNKSKENLFSIYVYLLSIPLTYFFFKTLHFKETNEWGYDANTKEVMGIINDQNKDRDYKDTSISISNHWLFAPSMNYYRDLYKMNYIPIPNRNGINQKSDYIYLLNEEPGNIDLEQTHKKIFITNFSTLLKKN